MSVNLSLEQKRKGEQDAPRHDRPTPVASALPRRHRGLAGRFLAWIAPGKPARAGSSRTASDGDRNAAAERSAEERGNPDLGMARKLIAQDRYGFVLLREAMGQIDDSDVRTAWGALNTQMALVPAGNVPLMLCDGSLAAVELEGFYLDRCAVTNRQFQRFVTSGAYDDLQIWPTEVWPSVARFTDLSGRPGPRDWEHGKFPAGKAEHPVVGVCWYEAVAYSRWVGKRLPTAAEWQKAGGWPEQLSGGTCNRYPWGNMYEPCAPTSPRPGLGIPCPFASIPRAPRPTAFTR